VNSVAFGNFLPPSEVVGPFYKQLKPLFENAIASGKRLKTDKSNSSKTAEKNNNDKKEVSHHNDSKRSVFIDGKPFKCNGVKVKGDSVKTYTKYFQCNMVLDQSDGSMWKPHNEVAKRASKTYIPISWSSARGLCWAFSLPKTESRRNNSNLVANHTFVTIEVLPMVYR
jgi:hypothetical protein